MDARKCLAGNSYVSLLLQLLQFERMGIGCCDEKLKKMYCQIMNIVKCLRGKLLEGERECKNKKKRTVWKVALKRL